MTNFTRKFLDEFAKDNKNTDLTVYGSTASGAPVTSNDPEVLQSNSKFKEGWLGATLENLTNNTRNPVRNEWSALDYIHNYHINHILQKGGQEYNSLTEYFIDDLVREIGGTNYYKSLTDNNSGNPLNDVVNWQLLGDLADLASIAPATETSSGVAELATQVEANAGVDDSRIITPLKLQGKFDLETPDNVVLVKQESDFGTPSGGVITLVTNTIYRIAVNDLYLNSRLQLPQFADITVEGTGLTGTNLIYTGNDTLFTGEVERLYIKRLRVISATGLATIFDLYSHPTFARTGEFLGDLVQFINFFSKGKHENMTLSAHFRVQYYQCGALTLKNLFAFTMTNVFSRNFVSTGQEHFIFDTNVNQGNISVSAFIPAKGESAFNIDPAITATSGISFGPAVPYQGNVIAGVLQYIDLGGGQVRAVVGGGHSFQNGDVIIIQFSANYPGPYVVSNVLNVDPTFQFGTFDFTATFLGDDAQGLAVLLDGATPKVEPFFKIDISGSIVSIADNGSGFARVNSIAHGLTTGQSLFISNTDAYDAGYYAIVIDVDNFDLLDSFGQPVPFTTPETGGNWNASSLNEKNNVVTVANTGGILPDSQTLGNNISTTTQAFASTTLLTRVSTGVWFSDEAQRFKATSDGRLIYTGRTTATVSISAKVVVQRQSGTTATAFMNIMEKRVGNPSFTEITNHPSSQNQITSSNASQLTVASFVDQVNPGDEFGIGIASDSALTLDIFSIDFNIKK
jgi:hypothetical protein